MGEEAIQQTIRRVGTVIVIFQSLNLWVNSPLPGSTLVGAVGLFSAAIIIPFSLAFLTLDEPGEE